MKIKLVTLSLVAAIILLISACSEEVIKSGSNNYNYFPLEEGNFVIYELDSIIYDDFNMTSTQVSYLVRELVESKFIDASGKEVFRIERAYKVNESDSWGQAGYDIWFANQDGSSFEKIEENQRYIKLSFPLKNDKEWEGNIHINTDPINNNDIDSTVENPLAYLDGWMYTVENLDEPYTVNGMTFDSTVNINQHEYGIQTDTIGSREVYATGVGLIYKEFYLLSTQCSHCDDNDIQCKVECFGSTWLDKGEDGIVLIQKIVAYGKL